MNVGIGAALIVLFVALAGLGYLLYGYIDTSEELKVVNEKAAQLQQENQVLQEQLNNANAEIENLNVQVSDLSQQILFWQEQARQFEEQNQVLGERNATLEEQNQELKFQYNAFVGQSNLAVSPNSTNTKLPEYTSTSLSLGIIIPILPVAIVATYIVARRQTKSSLQKEQGTCLNNMERGNMVKLSNEERREVIKMRRGR